VSSKAPTTAHHHKNTHWQRKLKLYGRMLVLMLLCYMFWWEPDSLRVESHNLTLSHWPVQLESLEIAVLSDLHIGAPYMGLDKLQEIVKLTNQQQAGLILIAGDLLVHEVLFKQAVSAEAIAQVLSGLHAPLGVWLVLGNHDYWEGIEPIKAALARHYINLLDDESVLLNYNGQRLWLAGISDAWEGRHDINKALKSIPPQDTSIVLTHNPDLFPDLPSWVNLTIAGHTHGGQIRFNPFIPSLYGDKYAAGHIQEQGHDLFVSTGLGTSIVPVRLAVPPEISLLRFSKP